MKPSDIFEGENSSLKRTFDSVATEEEIRKEFEIIARKLNLREETVSGVDEIGMVWNFILQIRREAIESVATPKEEEIREEFDKFIDDKKWEWADEDMEGNRTWNVDYKQIADYILKIRREAIEEERDLHLRREKHIIDILCKNCKQEYVEYAERNDL